MDMESLEDLHKQLLQCPVCLEDFHDETHTKVLPCLHLLCETCIPKIEKDGILPCPTCRAEHQAISFPTDNTTRDLSDFVVVKKSPSVACEGKGCEEGDIATHRCQPCGEFLCSDCVSAHKRTTMTRDHNMISLQELRDSNDFNAFCHPQTCQLHPGKQLELYCRKQECQKPICVTCAVVNHKYHEGHDLVEVDTVAESRRSDINTMISAVKEKVTTIGKVMGEITQEEKEIRSRGNQVYNEIDSVIDLLHQQIDRTKESLKNAVSKQVKHKCQSLEDQETKLKHLKSNMEHSVLYSEKVVYHSNIPAFLQLDKTISDRLRNLMVEPFDKEPWEMATFGMDSQGINNAVQNALIEKMHIWSSSIFPPNTKIKQMKPAEAGQTVVFEAEMLTSKNCPIAESVHFQAVVTDPRGDRLNGKIKDSGYHNGTFTISYVPMVEGKYELELTIQNKTIAKQIFRVGDAETNLDTSEDGFSDQYPDTTEKEFVVKHTPSFVAPELPFQLVANDPQLFASIRSIRFLLDKDTAHKEVTVMNDGTTFSNIQQAVVPKSTVSHPNRHKRFKGARGTHVFTKPGIYFYEVILEMKVVAQLQQNNIAFEIGIARSSSIDNKKYIEGQPYAWSMIGAHHPSCDSVCIHVVRDRRVLLHKNLVKNEVDKECRVIFGFLLNTDAGTWEIFNSEDGKRQCVVSGVNFDEPLFPVVSGYNNSQINVKATFVTGHESIPQCG